MSDRVRENVDAVIAMDNPLLAASVAWEARVAHWVDVAGAYSLAGMKLRLHQYAATGDRSTAEHPWHLGGRQGRSSLRTATHGLAAFHLSASDQAALYQALGECSEPFFVVAHAQIVGGRDEFDLVTESVQAPLSPGSGGEIQREHSPFPRRVEHGLVSLVLDGAQAMHPAHVMHAVHAVALVDGIATVAIPGTLATPGTLAIPIMESRVTSAANSVSSMLSLPAGRSGSTR